MVDGCPPGGAMPPGSLVPEENVLWMRSGGLSRRDHEGTAVGDTGLREGLPRGLHARAASLRSSKALGLLPKGSVPGEAQRPHIHSLSPRISPRGGQATPDLAHALPPPGSRHPRCPRELWGNQRPVP